jgi:hypothetical protein
LRVAACSKRGIPTRRASHSPQEGRVDERIGFEEKGDAAWSALWSAAAAVVVVVVGRRRCPCRLKYARLVRKLTTALLMRMYTSNEPPGGIRSIIDVTKMWGVRVGCGRISLNNRLIGDF